MQSCSDMTASENAPDNQSKHWFNNKTRKAVTLVIDPWGRNYTIASEMTVEFRMLSGAPPPALSIVQSVDAISIYIEQGDEAHSCIVTAKCWI
jgi:hypothetical protein